MWDDWRPHARLNYGMQNRLGQVADDGIDRKNRPPEWATKEQRASLAPCKPTIIIMPPIRSLWFLSI